jgi:hypothetical protein
MDESDPSSHQQDNISYPICVAQLHMVYHTTVILLHRLFIPNNTSDLSPEAISEYNTCAVSATAIMNIANRMLQHKVLRYVFHSVVYFVFTAGIIFINSASSSNDAAKSFDAKVNINNIMRLLEELEKTWTSASRSANILGELAGLRDLNLPTCENTLRPIVHQHHPQRSNHSSPILSSSTTSSSIGTNANAVDVSTGASSPADIRNYDETKQQPYINDKKQWDQHNIMMGTFSNQLGANTDYVNNPRGFKNTSPQQIQQPVGKGNMDPFAAPDTIPVPSQRQFDLSGAAFWGVPPSLDMEEWSHYLGTQLPNYQQQQYPPQQPSKIPNVPSHQVLPAQQQQSSSSSPHSSPSTQPHLIPSRNILSQFNPASSTPPSSSSSSSFSKPNPVATGPFTSMIHSQADLSSAADTSASNGMASFDRPPSMISTTLSNVSSPGTRFTRKHLIHSDANVDVLSGMSIPLDLAAENTPSTSLFGLLGGEPGASGLMANELLGGTQDDQQQQQQQQQQGNDGLYGSDGMIYY